MNDSINFFEEILHKSIVHSPSLVIGLRALTNLNVCINSLYSLCRYKLTYILFALQMYIIIMYLSLINDDASAYLYTSYVTLLRIMTRPVGLRRPK